MISETAIIILALAQVILCYFLYRLDYRIVCLEASMDNEKRMDRQ